MASNYPSSEGTQTVIGATGNARVAGDLTVIGKQTIIENVDVDAIHEQTLSDINLWTEGTVEPAALSILLDKIRTGSACVTITGSPGEGKSTLGFWMLRKLKESRKVYKVRSHGEFDQVIKTSAPVVLIDDAFGQTIFDKAAWEKWRGSLERFKEMKEQKLITGNIIIIGRDFVLKSGSRNTESPWEMFMDDEHVVNICREVRNNEEKRNILLSIAKKYDFHLDSNTIETICSIEVPHGFPHTCKMFIALSKKNSRLSAVNFFGKPFNFLKNSLKILITNEVIIEHIFMEMVMGDGHVVKRELSKYGSKYMTTADDLCTYIKPDGDGYTFDHPSIFDTVVLLLCETKLSLILERCSMECIRERVWMKTPDGKKRNEREAGAKLMAEIPWNEAEELAKRFAKEIAAGNLGDVMYHNAWKSDMFVMLMMKTMTASQLNVRDRRWVYDTLLHLLCEENRVDCVEICLQRGADVNRKSGLGLTPLHRAAQCGSTATVRVLLEHGADVNITGIGHTPLDLATLGGQIETAAVLRAAGGRLYTEIT